MVDLTFGQFIKMKREQLGYSITEVSEKSGIAQNSLSKYERDQCRPFATSLYKLAKVYEVSANDLEEYQMSHQPKEIVPPIKAAKSAIARALKMINENMTGVSV